jgi:hypothetical protein|tara:strand:- start:1016 stop:1342 length:327 start_codon:yes stop_codon:yes gene_type:complete
MIEFDKIDTDGSGTIDKSEWNALELENRRKVMEDEDAQRDSQRAMAWFCLWGMLLYPVGVVATSGLGLDKAANIIGDMASIYFLSVAGVVGVFFGVTKMGGSKPKNGD